MQTPESKEGGNDKSNMITITINIDDSIDHDSNEAIESLLCSLQLTGDNSVDPSKLQELLTGFPNEALNIRQSTHHPDWQRGEPCPECGDESMSVMCVEEDIYISADGQFEYQNNGEALGPQLSIRCRDCGTDLTHIPFQHLTV